MAHEKTIQAYANIGEDYQTTREKGLESTTRAQKAMIEKDTNKQVIVNNVYRTKIQDGSEVITWDQHTTGVTGIGNPVTYYENADDLCIWYEPIPRKETRFNVEKQEQEVVTKDIARVITHYIYPFNKENIAMVKKITANNSKHCNFYVRDFYSGMTRVVKGFEQWSKGDFDTLLADKRA